MLHNDELNKLLNDIESRTKNIPSSGRVLIRNSKEQIIPKKIGSGKRLEMIEELRRKSFETLKEMVKDSNKQEIEAGIRVEMDKLKLIYEKEVKVLEEEKNAAISEREDIEKLYSQQQEEIQSQGRVIELLRIKLQKTTEREIMNERKLKQFSKFEPIFDKLSERHDFVSAESLLQKLEDLEHSQLTLYTQMLEAQEQKSFAERGMEMMKSENEKFLSAKLMLHTQTNEKNERIINDLKNQLQESQAGQSSLLSMKDKYLELSFSVLNMYYQWLDKDRNLKRKQPHDTINGSNLNNNIVANAKEVKEDVKEEEEEEEEEEMLSNPLQVIDMMNTKLVHNNPTKASQKLKEINGVTNSVWMRFFAKEQELKSKPSEIIKALSDLHFALLQHTQRIKQKCKLIANDNITQRNEIQSLSRKILALQAEIAKLRAPEALEAPEAPVETNHHSKNAVITETKRIRPQSAIIANMSTVTTNSNTNQIIKRPATAPLARRSSSTSQSSPSTTAIAAANQQRLALDFRKLNAPAKFKISHPPSKNHDMREIMNWLDEDILATATTTTTTTSSGMKTVSASSSRRNHLEPNSKFRSDSDTSNHSGKRASSVAPVLYTYDGDGDRDRDGEVDTREDIESYFVL